MSGVLKPGRKSSESVSGVRLTIAGTNHISSEIRKFAFDVARGGSRAFLASSWEENKEKTTVNDQLLPEEIAATLFRGQRLCAVTRRVNVNSFDLSASAASDSVTSGTWQGRK